MEFINAIMAKLGFMPKAQHDREIKLKDGHISALCAAASLKGIHVYQGKTSLSYMDFHEPAVILGPGNIQQCRFWKGAKLLISAEAQDPCRLNNCFFEGPQEPEKWN